PWIVDRFLATSERQEFPDGQPIKAGQEQKARYADLRHRLNPKVVRLLDGSKPAVLLLRNKRPVARPNAEQRVLGDAVARVAPQVEPAWRGASAHAAAKERGEDPFSPRRTRQVNRPRRGRGERYVAGARFGDEPEGRHADDAGRQHAAS